MNSNNGQVCTIYIVRHGETEYNVKHIIQGHTDSALTDTGLKQAQDLAEIFRGVHFDAVFSSDLLRAKRTAEIIAAEKELAITTTKLLRERTFGKYDGQPAEKFREEYKDLREKLKTLSEAEKRALRFGKGYETEDELIARVLIFLREIAVAYSGKTVMVISHLGNIRALLLHLGFWPVMQELSGKGIENTAYLKLVSDGVDFMIKETKGIAKEL